MIAHMGYICSGKAMEAGQADYKDMRVSLARSEIDRGRMAESALDMGAVAN